MKKKILYIVIPCYDEEKCIEETNRRLNVKIKQLLGEGKIDKSSRIVYVDDGSKDKTWERIKKFEKYPIIGLKLAHNRGHQNALLAGLMFAKEYADVVISMDADLQDDINAIDRMIEKYDEGFEIVYGVRSERKKDSFFKRMTAQSFYKLMSLMGTEVVYNSADYRLMSKKALDELANYKEVNLFLRGIVPLIGMKYTTISYSRAERFAGESKYPLKKMLDFAWDGITSFSVKPLRMILFLGLVVCLLTFIVLIYSLIQHICGNTVDGWTFTVCSIWIVGGLQMACIGLIGEYIGKIYAETKNRPRFFVEEVHYSKSKENKNEK